MDYGILLINNALKTDCRIFICKVKGGSYANGPVYMQCGKKRSIF